jgi:predicted nucleic acid-binding protein
VKVLFDVNVVLDVLLAREPHAEVAATLLSLVDRGRIKGVLCAPA